MSTSSSKNQTLRNHLPADDVEEVRGSLTELDSESLEQRRTSLKQLLDSSLARYDSVMKRRLPSLAPGVRVRILRGDLTHQKAVVKEADYIAERALVEPAKGPARWIRFEALGPI